MLITVDEQIGIDVAVGRDHRLVRDGVELDLPGGGVHGRLHRVLDVVHPALLLGEGAAVVGLVAELGGPAVGIAVGDGHGVDHPLDAAVGRDRVDVGVDVEEGRRLAQPLDRRAVEVDARPFLDQIAEQDLEEAVGSPPEHQALPATSRSSRRHRLPPVGRSRRGPARSGSRAPSSGRRWRRPWWPTPSP